MGPSRGWPWHVALCLIVGVAVASVGPVEHETQQRLPLFVDTVGPENNPSETYCYHSLAYCLSGQVRHKAQTLGEVLGGSRQIEASVDIHFARDSPTTVICVQDLTTHDVDDFRRAVFRRYQFTMWLEGILLRGPVGEVDVDGTVYLYTTLEFTLTRDPRGHLADAAVRPDVASKVKLPDASSSSTLQAMEVTFAYSVKWRETDAVAAYLEGPGRLWGAANEASRIQWFGVCNSCAIAILLGGLFATTVLHCERRRGIAQHRLNSVDDVLVAEGERGRGGTHRFPVRRALLCSILGCGMQLLVTFCCVLILAAGGAFYRRGTVCAAFVVVYLLASGVAGFTSAAMYKRLGGTDWSYNMLATLSLFTAPAFFVWAFLNTVALVYRSTTALPFETIVLLCGVYLLVGVPLTLLGTSAGNCFCSVDEPRAPPHTKFMCVPSELPHLPQPRLWHRPTLAQIAAGSIPSTYLLIVRLFYILASIWGPDNLISAGTLWLEFVMLLAVTGFTVACLTYYQLDGEDRRWWWLSILTGGASMFPVYLCCAYYWAFHSDMSGFLQFSFYFGYMGLLCYALFLVLATVGFFAAVAFVRHVCRTEKVDSD